MITHDDIVNKVFSTEAVGYEPSEVLEYMRLIQNAMHELMNKHTSLVELMSAIREDADERLTYDPDALQFILDLYDKAETNNKRFRIA